MRNDIRIIKQDVFVCMRESEGQNAKQIERGTIKASKNERK